MAEWDVAVLGGVNTDYLVRGRALPQPGSSLDGEMFVEGPGGKGANQAVAAARLGARTALVARVGCDGRGRWVVSSLEAEGVRVVHLTIDPDAQSSRSTTAEKSRFLLRSAPTLAPCYTLAPATHFVLHDMLRLGAVLYGGNFAVRRDALDSIDGFDASIEFHGEDTNLGRRLTRGGRVRLATLALTGFPPRPYDRR